MNNGRGLQEDGSFNVVGPTPEKRVSSGEAREARQEFRDEKKEARKDREAERREMHASAPVKPSAQVKAADHVKPADQVRPADSVRPAAAARPADPVRPAAAVRPADPVRREAVAPLRQQDPAREQPKTTDLSGLIRQAVQAALGRGVTEEQVRRIVRQMVPAFVCNMSRMPPGGDVERVRVGLDGDTLVFREEGGPVGGGGARACELDVSADGTDLIVAGAEFMHGARAIVYAGNTVDGSGVTFDEEAETLRWVFLEANLASGSAEAKLSDDEHKPIDDAVTSGIYRLSLSQWRRTETSWEFVKLPHPAAEQHGIDAP